MDLGSFDLDETKLRAWLHADETQRSGLSAETGWTGWDPLEPDAESDVIQLLESAQREWMLRGPAQIGIIYIDDLFGVVYYVTVDLKFSDEPEGHALRQASTACEWNVINSGEQIGAEAAVAVLAGITAEANALLRNYERFTAPAEQAAYDRATQESLEVTDGIEAHDTCGCGEPIAYHDGEWMHVYNDQLRGTGDHDPAPS